jgi:hypothetical protein
MGHSAQLKLNDSAPGRSRPSRGKYVESALSREELIADAKLVSGQRREPGTDSNQKTGINRWLHYCVKNEIDPKSADDSTPDDINACISEYCSVGNTALGVCNKSLIKGWSCFSDPKRCCCLVRFVGR